MARDQQWEVTSYRVTMYGSRGFGWIHLKSGDDDAGYIYLDENPPDDGIFRGDPDEPYIVMSQPISNWGLLLDLLRNEKPLYIRGSQSADDQPVRVFFGTATEPIGENE